MILVKWDTAPHHFPSSPTVLKLRRQKGGVVFTSGTPICLQARLLHEIQE